MSTKSYEICVIGLGPAGIGAALRFARSSSARGTICLEAGVAADAKFCSILQGKGCRRVQPCQIITGVGGSSLLSGGKVSAFPAGRAMFTLIGGECETRRSLQRALEMFQEFVPLIEPKFSPQALEEASRQYRHLGFEFRYYDSYLYRQRDLVNGYNRMLAEIVGAGVSVHLETRVTQIAPEADAFVIRGYAGNSEINFHARQVLVAVGRFGIELLEAADSLLGLGAQSNHCDVGVRLELPTDVWPDINRYHNDLKLHYGDARTFCVCKDGYLAPYRVEDIFLVEGHAEPDRSSGFTNFAITIRHAPSDELDQRALLMEVRRRVNAQTGGRPVRQLLPDFLAAQPSRSGRFELPASISYWRWGDAAACFPEGMGTAVREAVRSLVARLLPGEAYSRISVFAPELDYFWQKFPLDKGFRSRKKGLYLIGDCAGHFRGILQAFCSGVECAGRIGMKNYGS